MCCIFLGCMTMGLNFCNHAFATLLAEYYLGEDTKEGCYSRAICSNWNDFPQRRAWGSVSPKLVIPDIFIWRFWNDSSTFCASFIAKLIPRYTLYGSTEVLCKSWPISANPYPRLFYVIAKLFVNATLCGGINTMISGFKESMYFPACFAPIWTQRLPLVKLLREGS